MNLISVFFVNRFNYDYPTAKNQIATIPFCTAISTPVLTLVAFYVSWKGHTLLLACLMMTLCFVIFRVLPAEPSILVTLNSGMLGLAYSLHTVVIFTNMALVLPTEATSQAVGFAISFQNLGLTVMPFVFGVLSKDESPESFNSCLYLLIALSISSSLLSVILIIVDSRRGKMLQRLENDQNVQSLRNDFSIELRNFQMKRRKLD